MEYKELIQALSQLDKKAQELDEIVKDVRVEINNVFWDLKEKRQRNEEVVLSKKHERG